MAGDEVESVRPRPLQSRRELAGQIGILVAKVLAVVGPPGASFYADTVERACHLLANLAVLGNTNQWPLSGAAMTPRNDQREAHSGNHERNTATAGLPLSPRALSSNLFPALRRAQFHRP